MINNIWVLIYKKLNNVATPEELEELDKYIEQDSEGKYPIELLEHVWQNSLDSSDPANQPSEDKWEQLQNKIAQNEKGKPIVIKHEPQFIRKSDKYYRFLPLIAALFLIAIGIYFYKFRNNYHDSGDIVVTAPAGALSSVQLPDGSKVTLNSGSKITYKNSFDSEHRELYLSGEAFFDVVKDPKHPFIVTTQTIRIRVLGTRFNVRSYPNDKTSEAALLRGSIELTVLKNPDRHIILKPAEKITITNEVAAGSQKSSSVDNNKVQSVELSQVHQGKRDTLPSEAMWMENKIAFDGLEFEEVAKMMERKYNVSIILENDKIKRTKITGKFENISLNKALKQLQVIANFNYKIDNNQVFINN